MRETFAVEPQYLKDEEPGRPFNVYLFTWRLRHFTSPARGRVRREARRGLEVFTEPTLDAATDKMVAWIEGHDAEILSDEETDHLLSRMGQRSV